MDAEYGAASPLNSVYKLQAVIGKAKAKNGIHWALCSVLDSVRMGFAEASDYSIKKLRSGAVDMFLMKQKLLHHLCHDFLDTHPFPATSKQKVRAVF
jgi:hypothetical protein